MESTLIVSSVNPLKNSGVLISGRREGVKQDAKMSLFFVLNMGGREGVKANKSNFFKYSLFFWKASQGLNNVARVYTVELNFGNSIASLLYF